MKPSTTWEQVGISEDKRTEFNDSIVEHGFPVSSSPTGAGMLVLQLEGSEQPKIMQTSGF